MFEYWFSNKKKKFEKMVESESELELDQMEEDLAHLTDDDSANEQIKDDRISAVLKTECGACKIYRCQLQDAEFKIRIVEKKAEYSAKELMESQKLMQKCKKYILLLVGRGEKLAIELDGGISNDDRDRFF